MRKFPGSVAGALLLLAATPALSGDDLPEGLDGWRLTGDSVSCINVRNIDTTDAIDDEHIVFEMRGNKVYLNRLSGRCFGLSQGDPFSYEISGSQLCRGEIIKVFDQAGTQGICALGEYEELEEAEDEEDEE